MELKQVINSKIYEKDGYAVEMYLDMSMEVYDLVKGVYKNEMSDSDVMEIYYNVIPLMVADWNLAGKNNEKLEINRDNLRKIPVDIFSWIIQIFSEIFSSVGVDKKKQSS